MDTETKFSFNSVPQIWDDYKVLFYSLMMAVFLVD